MATMISDKQYEMIQLWVDGEPVGDPVTSTVAVEFVARLLDKGDFGKRLAIEKVVIRETKEILD